MNPNKEPGRIHPLMAGAAASVMLVSLVGTAAITGILPTSHGKDTPAPVIASATPVPVAPTATMPSAAPTPASAATDVEPPQRVVHRRHVSHHASTAAAQPVQYAAQPPVYQQPAPVAQNSPVGIGVGAVVGGLLGSQVGGGKGRTLATIAGAVGGGYVGNEIAKRNQ